MTTPPIPESHPLQRLFRGLTETTFLSELGIGDPSLVGYIANLLVDFVRGDSIWCLRDGAGRRLRTVAEMVALAETTPEGRVRLECHRHVGDFTLFWTGVYPEALSTRTAIESADSLLDYPTQGKRAYHLASTLGAGDQAPIFRRLSDQFDLCAFGLSLVRKEWETRPIGL